MPLSRSVSHSAGKCLATMVVWEMQRFRLATTLFSFLKTSPSSAKKIAHRTNLASMANPLLPETLLPIMLAIVAFLFLLFFRLYIWLQSARRVISANTEQGISNHHLIKRLCGKGKAILIRLTGWLEDVLTLRPIRPDYGEEPLKPGLVWSEKRLIGTRYYTLIWYLFKTGNKA